MTSREFCYWLQGYFEVNAKTSGSVCLELNSAQAMCIAAHLALVFKHEIDPSQGGPAHQAELQKIHDQIDDIENRPEPFDHNTPIRC